VLQLGLAIRCQLTLAGLLGAKAVLLGLRLCLDAL